MIRIAALFRALLPGAALLVPALASAAPPAAVVVQRGSPDRLVAAWTSADPVDVFSADRADAPVATARLVAARDTAGKAVIESSAAVRRYVILRNARTGELTRAAERLVPLEAGSNFRDIGGYPAAAGRHVRWGMIYRSGATPLLTPADRERIRALGLINMIDLRSDEERVLAPSRIDGVAYTAIGYPMGTLMAGADAAGGMDVLYRRLPHLLAPHLRQIFAKLLHAEGPLVYNCSAGQDRTGFATAVVLSALGTDYLAILGDYHLSTALRRPEFEMPRLDPAQHPGDAVVALFARYQDDPRARAPQPLKLADGTAYLDFAFAELKDRWGGVDGYLRQEIGLSDRDIARLRALYTQ